MNLFNVYPRFPVSLSHGLGCYVYDKSNQPFLDLYGGHGVISIGHSHPVFINAITQQLSRIGFYSNTIEIPEQELLAGLLARLSGYSDYQLFMCNSGTEANENALKLASFHNGKSKIIAFENSFHGRTSAALNVTDNPRISAPINQNNFKVVFTELNNKAQFDKAIQAEEVCAVILEGIQGVGGLNEPKSDFLEHVARSCKRAGALLILDEIQSGYGRSGHFFAHQMSMVKPDIITMAKGMGNGFPLGGLLVTPHIDPWPGMLGSTFGGNYLACIAGIAVLETIQQENLIGSARTVGTQLRDRLLEIPAIKTVKGRGLMLGLELDFPIKDLRHQLLFKHRIFTGASTNPNLLRILPPLNISMDDLGVFIDALQLEIK